MASFLDGTVTDQNKVPVAGARVYIYSSPEGLAELEDGAAEELDNPVVTDELGYWKAFVADGYYTARFFWGGRQRYVEANLLAGDPPLGPNADANLRANLAANDGAALVKANSQRSVLLKLSEEWWIDDAPGADDTTKAQYLLAAGEQVIRTPARTVVIEDTLTPITTARIVGVGKFGSVISSLVDGWLFEIPEDAPGRLGLADLTMHSSRALTNSKGAFLFDNGNIAVERCYIHTFSGQGLQFVRGVGAIARDLRVVDCGRGPTGSGTGVSTAAVEFGGGGDVLVKPVCDQVYVTYAGRGIVFDGSTDFVCHASTTEYCNISGFEAIASNGLFSGCFQEGSLARGALLDDSDVRFSGWRSISSPLNRTVTWTDVAGNQRLLAADEPMVGTFTRTTDFTGTPAAWAQVALANISEYLFCTLSGGDLIAERDGMVTATSILTVLNGDAATQNVGMRVMRYPVGGGAAVECVGSQDRANIAAGLGATLSSTFEVYLALGDKLRVEFTTSDADCKVGLIPSTGTAAFATEPRASLSISGPGLIR